MTTASWSSALRDLYSEESARIGREFASTGDGRAAIARRTALVETIVLQLWKQTISPDERTPNNFAIVALGGFGRGWMFPHSDIDLLFLYADQQTEENFKDRRPAIFARALGSAFEAESGDAPASECGTIRSRERRVRNFAA